MSDDNFTFHFLFGARGRERVVFAVSDKLMTTKGRIAPRGAKTGATAPQKTGQRAIIHRNWHFAWIIDIYTEALGVREKLYSVFLTVK
jgi:hypothetical protein